MDAGLADAALKLERVLEHLAHERLPMLVLLAQLLDEFDAVGERGLVLHFLPVLLDDDGFVGDELGEAVRFRQGQVADARHVLHGQFGRHGAKGDHMRDVVDPVALLHVLDDPVAAFVVEVHVDIGHGDAFGIQETLEQQAVAERVQIGDSQAVGRHGTGG